MTNVNPQEIESVNVDVNEIAHILWDSPTEEQKQIVSMSTEVGQLNNPDNNKPDLSIEKLILKLGKEIAITTKENRNVEEIARLKEVALTYTGEDQLISFEEMADEIRNSPPVPKISSGISSLDSLMHGGFMTQTVTVISASPKSGKTSWCMYLTTKVKEYNPMW